MSYETGLKISDPAQEGADLEMCSVLVGDTLFGIPIAHILEIIGGASPQAVPLAPKFIGGLVQYRGDVVTTVSMRELLGLPNRAGRHDLLVLESSGGCFGLIVDSVGEVLSVSLADYEPNPTTLDQRRQALFAGAFKLKQGLLVMLDPERLDPEQIGPEQLDPERLESEQLDPVRLSA